MKVLISPESVEEAMSVIDYGMDILDVKNTKEGSLGAQFPWNTKRVVEACREKGIKTSATLGDLPFKPGTAALAAYGVAQTGVTYVKAGLHGMNTYEQAFEMMDAIRKAVRMVSDTADVVASGYADWRRFGGVSAFDVVKAARDAKCDLVMVDTAIKDGKTLFDNMSVQELKDFVKAARDAGLGVALAGSLKFEHAERLFEINPDLIGVRGAVCEDSNNRHTRICPKKTEHFVQMFHAGPAAFKAKAVA
ncbi:MAG: (5-formylfuran-3-yl)methyl phosphate synthase [Planctomycetes bacterium]|nr:(5-formylfuran-3-yl)methyl phosphate synthase [Planctomycetota bacterium]